MRRLAAAFILLLLHTPLRAQSQRGSIEGTVRDSSGAMLPGASITVTNAETGSVFRTLSGDSGAYVAPQLLPGFYNVTAELTGFKQLRIERVQVNVDSAVVLGLEMELGQINETVTVEGETALVNTESGALGHVVQNRQIVDLPLNGRNVFDLVNLTPGSFRLGGLISIAGGRTAGASAMLDGVYNSRGGLGQENIELSPPIDSMQEFKVQSNNMSAEFGRAAGGVVNATTRGGTNQFHGSAYEFLRNDLFDSQGWGVDQKASLRRNQFGATFGGPIRKNRSFFFYNYDGFRERRAEVRTRRVPTARERAGDFSQTQFETSPGVSGGILPIYDPLTGNPNGSGRTAFTNNMIPADRIDPIAQRLIALIPLPNLRNADGSIPETDNYFVQAPFVLNRWTIDSKMNWNATDKLTSTPRTAPSSASSCRGRPWAAATPEPAKATRTMSRPARLLPFPPTSSWTRTSASFE